MICCRKSSAPRLLKRFSNDSSQASNALQSSFPVASGQRVWSSEIRALIRLIRLCIINCICWTQYWFTLSSSVSNGRPKSIITSEIWTLKSSASNPTRVRNCESVELDKKADFFSVCARAVSIQLQTIARPLWISDLTISFTCLFWTDNVKHSLNNCRRKSRTRIGVTFKLLLTSQYSNTHWSNNRKVSKTLWERQHEKKKDHECWKCSSTESRSFRKETQPHQQHIKSEKTKKK
jgi:hypothetical protein